MNTPLSEFCCARLDAGSLARLGPLRAADVRARVEGDDLWLFWPEGEPELARVVLALDGAELFARRDGNWHRAGGHLPAFGVPSPEPARPLSSLLTPLAADPRAPDAGRLPVPLRLVPSDLPRPCSLLRVSLADLATWAECATSLQLESVVATGDQGAVLLRGDRLPPLAGERFWGRRVLLPLGTRAEPDLAEDILAAALRLEAGELALVSDRGAELVPLAAFAPLTRAGVRLAAREAVP
jgi:hypothetical protein